MKRAQTQIAAEHAKSIADMLTARQSEPAELVIAEALMPLLFPETVEPVEPWSSADASDPAEHGPWSFHGQEVHSS